MKIRPRNHDEFLYNLEKYLKENITDYQKTLSILKYKYEKKKKKYESNR